MGMADRVVRLYGASFAGLTDDSARLVAVGFRHGPVQRLHVSAIKGQLFFSSPVRGDLRGAGAAQAGFLEMFLNLLAARAVRFDVLAGVALDLRRAILSGLQVVAELPQPPRKLGSVHSRPVLLAAIELLRLDRAVFSLTRFRHVEEDHVGV